MPSQWHYTQSKHFLGCQFACRMAKEVGLCRLPQPISRSLSFTISVSNAVLISCQEIRALTKAYFHLIHKANHQRWKWNPQKNLLIQVLCLVTYAHCRHLGDDMWSRVLSVCGFWVVGADIDGLVWGFLFSALCICNVLHPFSPVNGLIWSSSAISERFTSFFFLRIK